MSKDNNGAPHTQKQNKAFKVIIDGKHIEIAEPFKTGAELKALAGLALDSDLYLKTDSQTLIANDTVVDLAQPGVENFFSENKPVKLVIIVNGREKSWTEKTISFEQLVTLAFDGASENPNRVYTVTYSRGSDEKPEGTMVKGSIVRVKNKMIFNVTATDRS